MIKYLINPTNKLNRIELLKNEQLKLFLIVTQSIDYRLDIILSGQNAQADIYGIMIGDKSSLINIKTVQLHQAPNTRSNLLVKSVLSSQSQLNFEGLIKVEKSAQKTDAYQKNANLLLSENAKAETKPVLEILANDVKCTHGATVGNIDQEQLFYLQNRGISEINARKLLIRGFFLEILEKISDQSMIDRLVKQIDKLII